jgi:murein DD-endopeptidase MepM/ murein hydrolase activator NlpD
MIADATRTRRQMIGSVLGLLGVGVVGLSRLGRVVPTVLGAGNEGIGSSAIAGETARRVAPPTTTTTTTTTLPPPGELAFPVDPAGGLLVLNNFSGNSVSQGPCAHKGIDIFVEDGVIGRPLLACTDALLQDWRLAPGSGSQGNAWILEDANGDIYRYHHLDSFESGLEPGMTVARNQVIGYMGTSGNANYPHLHFEVRRGGSAGTAENPVPLLPFPIPEVTLGTYTGCS